MATKRQMQRMRSLRSKWKGRIFKWTYVPDEDFWMIRSYTLHVR